MNIEKFWNNQISKYSFQSLGWMLWFKIILFCFLYIIAYFFINGEMGDTAAWYLIFFAPSVILPIVIYLTFAVYTTLLYKEKHNDNFRIKNAFLTSNHLYKLVITFTALLEIIICILMGYAILMFWILVHSYAAFFILYGLPIILIIVILQIFIIKIFC